MTTIRFEVPETIEQSLRARGGEPSAVMKEAALVELYRRREISHHQLSDGLGLGRIATNEVLRRHDVMLEISGEELREEIESLRGGRR